MTLSFGRTASRRPRRSSAKSAPVRAKEDGVNLKTLVILGAATTLACSANGRSSASSDALPKSADQLNWTRYTDSAEAAFSIEVPLGWQVQGGMYRFGYFDVRWMMDVRSLDGKVILRVDDVNIPPYTLPGPHTGREGQPYFKPQQFQMMVSNYREAQPYLELYAKRRFATVCQTLTPRSSDWAPVMPSAWQTAPGARSSQGRVAYDCATSDGARIVAAFARTILYPGNGLWVVDPVLSVIATPASAPLAYSMVQRMIDSWQKSPQWEAYQQRMTQMGLAQIQAGFNQFMRQMQAYHQARTAAMNQQVAHFEAQQNAQAQQVSGWGETLTGLVDLSDPATGNRFQVFSGPKANYYSNGKGVTINSNLSPGLGFHQVNQVGP